MAAEALQSLVLASPASLLDEIDGTTVLAVLYDSCESAGLLSSPAEDDSNRLYGLFNVALEHGAGSVVLDYLEQVCFGAGLNPSHPSSGVLSDPQRIAVWLQSSLAAARLDLSAAIDKGLSSLASSQVAPRYVAKLHSLTLVADSLADRASGAVPAATTAARVAHRTLADAATSPPAELAAEAHRLLQAARVAQWLCGQRLLQSSPSGRFSTHAAWEGTVDRRRKGAGAGNPLFLSHLMEQLAQHDVDPIAYPPSSPEALLQTLFFSGSPSQEAFRVKLQLLTYTMVDANYLGLTDIAGSLHRGLGIPKSSSVLAVFLLFLDDAQIKPPGDPKNHSLAQAVNCVVGVDPDDLPPRVMDVFLKHQRAEVALGLLRERGERAGGDPAGATTALRVRLESGMFVEAFIELQRSVAAVPEAQRAQHATRLMDQILAWAAASKSLHNVARLPVDPRFEEPALISWLQQAASRDLPAAGIILPLYFLMRGRAPEALLAYAQHGAAARAVPDLAEGCSALEGLLRSAAAMIPAAQRALVVGTAPKPALLFAGEEGAADVDGGAVALASALPGLDTGGMPALLSVGPTPADAPLVGGALGQPPSAAAGRGSGAATVAAPVPPKPAAPLLFGQASTAGPKPRAGGALKFGEAVPVAPATAGRRQHQLDVLLGLPTGQKTGVKGSRRGMR